MDARLSAVAAIVLGAVIAGAWIWWRRERTERLRARFGPEYERAVQDSADVHRAEAQLEARAKRVERLHVRRLNSEDATRFSDSWRRIQAQFVDDPRGATTEADRLVGEVMQVRGYPLGDFEQRAADISVDHPHVVFNYRAARDIAQRQGRGEATTEELRQAMVHYRALFTDLLETEASARDEQPTVTPEPELVRGRR